MPEFTFAVPLPRDDNEDDLGRMPLIEAQQDHLARILAARIRTLAVQVADPFQHGERVRYIENAGDLLAEVRTNVVLLYWRKMDLTSPFDLHLIRRARDHIMGLPSVDCLVAHLTSNNQLIFSIASSELLERWRDP